MSNDGELKSRRAEDDDLTQNATGSGGQTGGVKVAGAKGSRDSPFIQVWTLELPPERTTSLLQGALIEPIAISSDGRYVVTVHRNSTDLILYDVSLGLELARLTAHEQGITCLAMVCDDDHVISGAADGSLKVWRREEKSLETILLINFSTSIRAVSAHPKHKMFAVCLEGNVIKLRHMNNKDVDEVNIEIQDSKLTGLVLGDSQLVYGTDVGKIYVWNYEDVANPVCMLDGHVQPVQFLSLRDQYLASIGQDEQCVVIWNTRAGKKLGDMYLGGEKLTALTWSNDMHYLIVGLETCMVHIYDAMAQRRVASLNVYSPVIHIVARSEHISILTKGGRLCVYKLQVSDKFDPSVYSDSLESRYSTSSLRHSSPTLSRGDLRRSSTCDIL